MITYALIDPRTGIIKYVGTTKNPPGRLAQHMSSACFDPDGDPPSERWKEGWIAALRLLRLKPVMLKLADGDFERTLYKFFKATGAKLLNRCVPPRRFFLTDQRAIHGVPVPELYKEMEL
jgi:hypothetical protein